MFAVKVVVFLFFVVLNGAVLPPGFEDELYCPAGMCLAHAPRPKGWCGPKTQLYLCSKEGHAQDRTHPRGWGNKVEMQVKEKLIKDGYALAESCDDHKRHDALGLFVGLMLALRDIYQVKNPK